MSLASNVSRVGYVGAGTTQTFSFPFKIFDPTELLVANLVVATGVQTTLILNTDYSVSGVGNPSGGQITLTVPNLPIGTNLVIVRKRQLLQNTDLRNQGDYYPEAVEDTFDQLVMNDQQIQRELNSALKLPLTTDPTVFNPTLPSLTPANASLVINSTGVGFAMGPTADQLAAGLAAGTQALTSAQAAATSQGAAAVSATAAALSATQASGFATASQNSAQSSANSATSSQSLAGQAQTSANNASASATSANTSAQNAAGSATSASTSATNAATSATNAAGSATSAASSAAQAQQSSQVIPTGGSTGQILVKKSSTNYDTQWTTNAAGITQLTGDVTAGPGSGSVPTTISGLARNKLATDTPLANVYNDASGNLVSEAQTAKVRGGTGTDNSNVTFPTTGTIGVVPASGFVKSSGTAFSSQSAINLANSDVTGTLPVAQGGTGSTSLPASGFVKSSGTALTSVSAITLGSADTTGILPTGNGGTGQNSTATFPTSGTVGVVPAAGFVKSASGQLTSQTSISLTSDVSGTLPVGSGGTGATSLPASGFVTSNGTALSSKTAIALTTDISGTLPIANGGTNLTAIPSAGFITSDGTNFGSKSKVVLTADVSGLLPSANGGTGVNSTATYPSSGTIATTPAAGFVKSSGTALTSQSAIGLATSDVNGTLPIANGGTNATTASAALTNLLPSQSSASGQYLTSNGTAASWAAVPTAVTTTKGDLSGYSTMAARVPIGTNGQILMADSTQALGLKWVTPIAAKFGFTANTAVSANAVIPFTTTIFDTAPGWSTSTFRWTVPTWFSGYLKVSASGAVTSGSATIYIWKNAASDTPLTTFSTTGYACGYTLIAVVPGDILDVRSDTAVTVGASTRFTIGL